MISTRCIKTALMSLALTTPALMDSVPNVNGLKLTMRVSGGNPSHSTRPLEMVEEDEEGPLLTESETQIMLYIEDGLNSEDATKLDYEMNKLDASYFRLKKELRDLDIEQRAFYKFHYSALYKDKSDNSYKGAALEFDKDEERAKAKIPSDELSELRQKRNSALKQKAESKSRE